MWQRRFKAYHEAPREVWPESRWRHVDKLLKFGHETDAVIDVALRRLEGRPKTMFVVNAGSSGSHWLTTMLAETGVYADCGEVYLPPQMLRELRDWPVFDRVAFIDAVHLAHLEGLDEALITTRLINSAHMAGWRIAAVMDSATVVLLVRDPLDIVLSRTWRKPEYREYIASEAEDTEFLDENIRFVRTFFENIGVYDVLVRYEDVREDAADVLGKIVTVAGASAQRSALERAARTHSVGSSTTNAYKGPKVEIPGPLRERAEKRLADIRLAYGYA